VAPAENSADVSDRLRGRGKHSEFGSRGCPSPAAWEASDLMSRASWLRSVLSGEIMLPP
jgi:hypothetical protein